MNKYINYHKHDHTSNIFTPDVNVKPVDYVNRILELGCDTYFTTNHGFGGDVFDSRDVCDQNNIHCKFGIEGYIVPNPLEKDARNYHIILIPKTNKARKKLNLASSHANTEGFYYKPRFFVSDLLNNFDDDDLYITTACCFLKDNKVLTNNGYKNIQDVKSGDFVKNINGEFEEVNYPTKIGYNGKGYCINTNNYIDDIKCTADHKFLITTLNDIAKHKEPRWAEANELLKYNSSSSKPILLYPINIAYTNKNTISKSEFENCFKEIKHKWNVKQELPNKITITTQFMRMIGLFIGDGHISLKSNPRIGFTINSEEYEYYNSDIFIPIENQLGIKFNRSFRLNNHRVDIDTSSVDMINLFYYLFGDCKANTKHIPNRLLHISKEFDLELLLGMFLSDGSFKKSSKWGYNTGSCIYCSISKTLITQTQDLCSSLGIKTIYEIGREKIDKNNVHHQKSYKITISSKMFYGFKKEKHITTEQWASIIDNLYENSNQNPIVVYKDKKYLKVRIKNIDEIFINEDVYCLNNNTHSFVLNGCIVHNCAGIIRDDDSTNQIFYPLYEKYGKNLMLEVQNHNADIQKAINKKALKLHKELGLPLICANDSHYIYPNQAKERLELLKGKGINYGDEDTFILDYPDYETFAQRFKEQGLLTDKQIADGIEQTLIFEECEDIDINKEIKMPTIYPELSNDEKIELLKKTVNDNFKIIMKQENVSKEKRKQYVAECRKEMKVIEDTNEEIHTADYFLLNKKVFDLASNKYHGTLTKTGRGSCGSFVLNKMLGMTQIDRLTTDLPLYSERFISTARLLENHSMADYDFNCASQEPFIKATRELLGEYQCYPMLAYGTMKEAEAFRNVCRSHGLEFSEFNEVGKNLDQYRNDPYWKPYIDEAQIYISTIISCSVHPCSFLLMNEDIREELGIVKIGDAYCAPITSAEADAWKYLKNDYLIVTVWDIIKQTFDLIGKPIMSIKELEANLDNKVWDLFAKGYTATLNQTDGDWSTSLIKRYKPRTVSELAKFVACIRPSFESMREDFIARKPYTTGFKNVDNLFKSTDNRVLFQENIMQYFEWLGISPSNSIGLIKKISKKKIKPEDFANLEDTLKKTWKEKNGTIDGFEKSWADMQAQMKYSFNSPHGLAYAYDCLYCAYLKAHYPLEYYTVVLNIYKDDVEKTNRLCEEMKHFSIELANAKFRYTSGDYGFDKETNTIYKSVTAIKNIGSETGDKLYALKDNHYPTFIDLLKDIDANKCCNSRELDILIRIDYFSEFGNPNQLLEIVKLYNKFGSVKVLTKSKLTPQELEIASKYAHKATEKQLREIDTNGLLSELIGAIKASTDPLQQICYDVTYLGYTNRTYDAPYYAVTALETNNYGTTYISLYNIQNGSNESYKLSRKWDIECEQGDILEVSFEDKHKHTKDDNGNWVKTNVIEKRIKLFNVILKNPKTK